MTEFANMSPARAAYLAFCREVDGKPMTNEERQHAFESIARAAIEANDWLREYKPDEAIKVSGR